jgi:hypothetical protein
LENSAALHNTKNCEAERRHSSVKAEPWRELRGKWRSPNFLCATRVQISGGSLFDKVGKNIAQTIALELMSQIPDLELSPVRQELERVLSEPGWA